MLHCLQFDNALLRELPGDQETGPRVRQVTGAAWSKVEPNPVAAPRLIAWSQEMAEQLGLSEDEVRSTEFAAIFAGNALVEGMQPFATNYGGHQFGHWAGQLGDGRAISLGEVINAQGQRWELQLKGAGLTPYSRTADGRAVLRSSVREFLCSEAMHHLGVPTTRALSLVGTGEMVMRDMFYDGHPQAERGAVVCRVAPSFLRFGHFELPASRGDQVLLRQLADFCIRRDFPELLSQDDAATSPLNQVPFDQSIYARWFAQICERTAVMIAHWMRVGFVHGVMNTDNMSVLGLTIDYGPYGWIDNYDPDWTPNTTDAQGRRYRFGWQPKIARWNLVRLAQALSLLFDTPEQLLAGLERFDTVYAATERDHIAGKLGLAACNEDDVLLMSDLYDWMRTTEVDMTLLFSALTDINVETASASSASFDEVFLDEVFYDQAKRQASAAIFDAWLARYRQRLSQDSLSTEHRHARMRAANPRFVLRNYLAQQAIDRAEAGDETEIAELLEVMRHPYQDQPGRESYAGKRPDWARTRAGCSMLSCSS